MDPAKDAPIEVELKLTFPAEARARIDRHPALQEASSQVQHLRTVYYDTPDLTLERSGLTLRVRTDGDQRVQTLKSKGVGNGVAQSRGEWEWPIRTDKPDFGRVAGTEVGGTLDPHIGDRLEPILVTDVHRTVRSLLFDGGATVEVAIDDGSIRAGDAQEPVREIELELKAGPVAPLYRLALELHSDLPLLVGAEPKSARGYRLKTGQPPRAEKAHEPDLDRHMRGVDALRRIVASGLGGLLANQPAAAFADPEGIHQMRIAIRRLRTALVLFKPHLESHAATRFEIELRRLGGILGSARDSDVFCLETLPAGLDRPSEESWGRLLGRAAEKERTASHRVIADEFTQGALTGLVLGLAAWVEDEDDLVGGKALGKRLSDLAPDLLDRVLKKVLKRGRHIERRSSAELHAVRKSLKKLRYSADYFASLFPRKSVKLYLKRCKRLLELLGELNDATMALTLSERLDRDVHLDLVPALGALAHSSEKRRKKALRRLPDAWDEFSDAAPFWRS